MSMMLPIQMRFLLKEKRIENSILGEMRFNDSTYELFDSQIGMRLVFNVPKGTCETSCFYNIKRFRGD